MIRDIGAAASVFADHDSSRRRVIVLTLQLGVVPAQEAADLVGVVGGEGAVGFSAEAVGSEIFTHKKVLSE